MNAGTSRLRTALGEHVHLIALAMILAALCAVVVMAKA